MRISILISCLFLLCISCNFLYPEFEIRSQDEYFKSIAVNDVMLSSPNYGDWLYDHKESGQRFIEYKFMNPIRPTRDKATIYLMPLGDFTPKQMEVLELTREYISIFYQQKTVLLPHKTDKNFPERVYRDRGDNIQLLAGYILDTVLKDKTPKDGIALMAFSEKDLFPKPEWNFVFGLASYKDRVGVSSMFRLHDGPLTDSNFALCLKRLCNVSSHEIGHMFSMKHCTHAECTMNGSNGMSETDRTPNRLCTICQKKMVWNFKYDSKKRLLELIEFFKRNKLDTDLELLQNDLLTLPSSN